MVAAGSCTKKGLNEANCEHVEVYGAAIRLKLMKKGNKCLDMEKAGVECRMDTVLLFFYFNFFVHLVDPIFTMLDST